MEKGEEQKQTKQKKLHKSWGIPNDESKKSTNKILVHLVTLKSTNKWHWEYKKTTYILL